MRPYARVLVPILATTWWLAGPALAPDTPSPPPPAHRIPPVAFRSSSAAAAVLYSGQLAAATTSTSSPPAPPSTTTSLPRPRPAPRAADTTTTTTAPSPPAPTAPGDPPPLDRTLRRIGGCESSIEATPTGAIVWDRYFHDDPNSRTSTASGGFQTLDSTWRTWAARYGGDVNATAYRRAALAPWWVQQTVVVRAYDAGGTTPWNASRGCWSG